MSMQLLDSSKRSPSPHALTGAFSSIVCGKLLSDFVAMISTSGASSSKHRYDPTVFSQPSGHNSFPLFSHSLMSK